MPKATVGSSLETHGPPTLTVERVDIAQESRLGSQISIQSNCSEIFWVEHFLENPPLAVHIG